MYGQTDEHFSGHKKYLFCDKVVDSKREGWNYVLYDDKLPYQERFLSCLEQIEDEIVLFHHEDMFLYDKPDYEQLNDFSRLIQDEELDVIKLIRASYTPDVETTKTQYELLYENPHNLKFAIQPSLCSTEKLKIIYKRTGGENIWKFEENSSQVCEYFGIKTAMTYAPEDKQIGTYHWDSRIYPYFATAIVKGKWNIEGYPSRLPAILDSYNIDTKTRGTTNEH